MGAAAVEYYLLPGDLPEDIKQEMAISKLTGRRASMKRLKEKKDIGYGLQPAEEAVPIWSTVQRPDFTLLEKLADFIVAQEEKIKHEILAYLSEPDDGRLAKVVAALGKDQSTWVEQPKLTLTQLIVKVLPTTIDQLYGMAREIHPSKKPEAAVRQNVRNLIKQNKVRWEGDVLCLVRDSVKPINNSYENVDS